MQRSFSDLEISENGGGVKMNDMTRCFIRDNVKVLWLRWQSWKANR